jgi:drug/metabolite transporter (DMT)-like permease
MPYALTLSLTTLAMLAFAGNSLLCRAAFAHTAIDPASFTAVRLAAGALALWAIVRLRSGSGRVAGDWPSALALFAYAASFSFAYVSLSAATGALLLFGAVHATMIAHGLWSGERLGTSQSTGLVLALGGLVGLLLPGLTAPPLFSAFLMLAAGIAWGIYSLRGRGVSDPTVVTAGNFLRTVPLAALLSLLALPWVSLDVAGFGYAVASGALASGIGYAIWYAALRGLKATSAATVQLGVPLITALAGVALLGEAITPRLLLAGAAILGGIALVVLSGHALVARRNPSGADER